MIERDFSNKYWGKIKIIFLLNDLKIQFTNDILARYLIIRTMRSYLSFLSIIIIIVFVSCSQSGVKKKHSLKLWYKQAANASIKYNHYKRQDDPEWLKALPLGNGSLGAMVYGDVNLERIQLNEESMWSGSAADNDNPDAYPAVDKIRNLLFEGKYKEATDLTNQTQICKGKGSGHGNGANVPYGSFQTLGDLWIDFVDKGVYENYYRELDMDDAIVRVSYTQNQVH